MNDSLHRLFLNNGGTEIHKWLHYFDIYERYFNQYVGKDILMVEIGVSYGGSIDMWKKYFGPQSVIVGIDINPACKKVERPEDNIFIEIGDQSDTKFLQSIIDKYGRPDVILDDGSHIMTHLIKTFEFLYYEMKENGTYVVEDLHTAYWPDYEGGLRKKGTFIEYTKDLVDELNAQHTSGLVATDFTRSTQSMHFYDSVVVFEKRPQGLKQHVKTGRL